MWLAVLGVAGVGLKLLVGALPYLGDIGPPLFLAATIGGTVAAWWFLCWLGFRIGIR